MKKIIFILVVFQFYSCKKENIQTERYYYGIYDKNENIKGFFKRVVTIDNTKRVDSVFRYNKNKEPQNIRLEEFEENADYAKSSNGDNYLIISKKDTCYIHTNSANDEYKTCYLGNSNLSVNKVNYKNAYKFLISEMSDDGVIKYRYFDKNFVLIREEFKEGFLDYYRIDRVDRIEGLK